MLSATYEGPGETGEVFFLGSLFLKIAVCLLRRGIYLFCFLAYDFENVFAKADDKKTQQLYTTCLRFVDFFPIVFGLVNIKYSGNINDSIPLKKKIDFYVHSI